MFKVKSVSLGNNTEYQRFKLTSDSLAAHQIPTCPYEAPNLCQYLLRLFLPKLVIIYKFHVDDLTSNFVFFEF